MTCNCPVCSGRNINEEAFAVADEVILFIKKDVLKLKNINQPFPLKYNGLLASVLAYSQALNYDRIHGNFGRKYFSDNKHFLKLKDDLNEKFKEIVIMDVRELNGEEVQEVCEFNVGKNS